MTMECPMCGQPIYSEASECKCCGFAIKERNTNSSNTITNRDESEHEILNERLCTYLKDAKNNPLTNKTGDLILTTRRLYFIKTSTGQKLLLGGLSMACKAKGNVVFNLPLTDIVNVYIKKIFVSYYVIIETDNAKYGVNKGQLGLNTGMINQSTLLKSIVDATSKAKGISPRQIEGGYSFA